MKVESFDDKNENTEFLNNVLNFLNQFQNDSIATKRVYKTIRRMGTIRRKNSNNNKWEKEQFNINGFFMANQAAVRFSINIG